MANYDSLIYYPTRDQIKSYSKGLRRKFEENSDLSVFSENEISDELPWALSVWMEEDEQFALNVMNELENYSAGKDVSPSLLFTVGYSLVTEVLAITDTTPEELIPPDRTLDQLNTFAGRAFVFEAEFSNNLSVLSAIAEAIGRRGRPNHFRLEDLPEMLRAIARNERFNSKDEIELYYSVVGRMLQACSGQYISPRNPQPIPADWTKEEVQEFKKEGEHYLFILYSGLNLLNPLSQERLEDLRERAGIIEPQAVAIASNRAMDAVGASNSLYAQVGEDFIKLLKDNGSIWKRG